MPGIQHTHSKTLNSANKIYFRAPVKGKLILPFIWAKFIRNQFVLLHINIQLVR